MATFPGQYPHYKSVDALTKQYLFLPGVKPVQVPHTLAAGLQVLPGTVLGRITATGLLTPCVKTASDGSQNPYGINTTYLDSTATGPQGASAPLNFALTVWAYVNSAELVIDPSWGSTPDAAWLAIEPSLRFAGIFGRAPIYSR